MHREHSLIGKVTGSISFLVHFIDTCSLDNRGLIHNNRCFLFFGISKIVLLRLRLIVWLFGSSPLFAVGVNVVALFIILWWFNLEQTLLFTTLIGFHEYLYILRLLPINLVTMRKQIILNSLFFRRFVLFVVTLNVWIALVDTSRLSWRFIRFYTWYVS